MISRFGNKGFLVAHYDWVALGVAVLALAGGVAFYVMSLGEDADEAAAAAVADVNRLKPGQTGVKPVDMTAMRSAVRLTRSPAQLAEVSEKGESFLASERRVRCVKCKKAIPGDVKAFPACPFCNTKQKEEQKVVLDMDKDGLPDEWEKRYGLNPGDASDADKDTDGDDFTNLEEFLAKTDPTDRNDHPDYLDSLKLQLPLKETYMPFILVGANKIPAGWRCTFHFPNKKDTSGYAGRQGLSLTAVNGEEVGDSGFVFKSFEKKEGKRAIKGGQGLMRTVDVSEVLVERKRDGKKVTLVMAESKREKPMPVDVQATLAYERGAGKSLDVVPGSEIELSGRKYRISAVTAVGKGAKVTVEDVLTHKKRVLEALEQ